MTNKDESQQQVPPGIVAFKDLHSGEITNVAEWYGTWGGRKPDYDAVYRHLMNGENTHIIWTIEVDGKEWSCQDDVYPVSEEWHFKIKSFEWTGKKWIAEFKKELWYSIDALTKPPPSSPDRAVSQPGKEKPKFAIIGAGPEAMGESARRMLNINPQPSQPGERGDDLESNELPDWEGAYKIMQEKFIQTHKELTALKSRPSEGWSDEDMKEAWMEGIRTEYQIDQLFIQWLSSYKQTKQ